jgi:hypothetical protein
MPPDGTTFNAETAEQNRQSAEAAAGLEEIRLRLA